MAMLVPILGNFPGRCYPHPLDAPEKIIGRRPECEIVASSDSVSSRHARIFFSENVWHISDLGSVNGVILNGEKIGTAVLRDGDVFHIGELFYAFSDANPHDLGSMSEWLQEAFINAKRMAASHTSTAYLVQQTSWPVQPVSGPSNITRGICRVVAVDLARNYRMGAGTLHTTRRLQAHHVDPDAEPKFILPKPPGTK